VYSAKATEFLMTKLQARAATVPHTHVALVPSRGAFFVSALETRVVSLSVRVAGPTV
jgi:hypothetical protein